MDILIFSDSHGRSATMQMAIDRQRHAPDWIFFLGDGLQDTDELQVRQSNLLPVRGNCDLYWDSSIQTEELISIAGHKILLTHGHLFGVKSGYGALISHAFELGADIALFGHTHEPMHLVIPGCKTPLESPLHLFNPGSIRYGGSFGTLTIRGSEVLFSHGQI